MIILDNSVLSSMTRLGLLTKLKELFPEVYITTDIIEEYSVTWKKQLPSWIIIKEKEITAERVDIPTSLSATDISVIELALELDMLLASDDKIVRNYSRKVGIKVTAPLVF